MNEVIAKNRSGWIKLEKTYKYAIISITELPGANITWDLAERGAWLFYFGC